LSYLTLSKSKWSKSKARKGLKLADTGKEDVIDAETAEDAGEVDQLQGFFD